MNPSQRRFLEFHCRHVEITWRWHFGQAQLRAAAAEVSATIWFADLDELVDEGLMTRGIGCADFHITNAGREVLK